MLKEIELLPVYDSEDYDLICDLQVPLLQQAKDYLRGVGFFTSGWLRLAAQGMTAFVIGGGSARIVVSPILDGDDWEAMKHGEAAKTNVILREALSRNIEELAKTLEHDTRNALAWMVADGLIEFRFAISRDQNSGSFSY